ncbi:Zona pellucida domain [Trinorchestia longiramus]|nr:Zona pellucida domain [Trinorchestia longiramus]
MQNWKKGVTKYETDEGLKLLSESAPGTNSPLNTFSEKPKFVFQDLNNSVIIQTNIEEGKSINRRKIISSKEVFDFEKLANITKDLSEREVIVQTQGDEKKYVPKAVISEIKISSSPNSEESEAMVASTLLTVSSRVRDRLMKNKADSEKRGGLADGHTSGGNDLGEDEDNLKIEKISNSEFVKSHEAESKKEEEGSGIINKEGRKGSQISKNQNEIWNVNEYVLKKDDSNEILQHILAQTNSDKKSSKAFIKNGYLKENRSEKSNNEKELSSNVINDWRAEANFLDLNSWHIMSTAEEEPVSVWLDILRGNGTNGSPASEGLTVGEDATLVVSARTAPGLTTLVTECRAYDGTNGTLQDLSDSRGCAVDPSIMPGLRKKTTQEPRLKIEYASFRAFKFPERTNLHIKCTVLICLGECPELNCKEMTTPTLHEGRRERTVREVMGLGEFKPSDILVREAVGIYQPRGGLALSVGLELEEFNFPEPNNFIANVTNDGEKQHENETTSVSTTPTIETTTSPTALSSEPASADSTSKLKSESYNGGITPNKAFGMIVDKIEVFNSVEVTAPGEKNEPQDFVKQHRLQDDDASSQEELLGGDVLCIASQKLAVAFGLLVTVMAGALVFALYTCVRHRLLQFSRTPHETRAMRRYVSSPTPSPTSASSTLGFFGHPKPLPPLSGAAIIAPRNYYGCHL